MRKQMVTSLGEHCGGKLESKVNRSCKVWVLVSRGKEYEKRMKRVMELEVMIQGQYCV